MRQINGGILSNQQEVWIKRYYEIHFDYSSEFKSTSEAVQRKRDSWELMHSSREGANSNEQNSSMANLLREKLSVASAMKSINDVVG
jgi:hypothetical protein